MLMYVVNNHFMWGWGGVYTACEEGDNSWHLAKGGDVLNLQDVMNVISFRQDIPLGLTDFENLVMSQKSS